MLTSAHTPGPLTLEQFCDCHRWSVAKCPKYQRLIAAAPRMLELLQEVAAFRDVAEQEHDPIMLRLTGEAMRIIKETTNA